MRRIMTRTNQNIHACDSCKNSSGFVKLGDLTPSFYKQLVLHHYKMPRLICALYTVSTRNIWTLHSQDYHTFTKPLDLARSPHVAGSEREAALCKPLRLDGGCLSPSSLNILRQ